MKFPENRYPSVKEMDDDDRIRIVREIFSTITGKYDFLNHFLSLRRDVAWRRFAVEQMRFFNTNRFLDVATGTSDLAIEATLQYPDIHVTGLDLVHQMLVQGMKKVQGKGLTTSIDLIKGDALHIPLPDQCFDVAGAAFGIRNIPDKIRALTELKRVVVPGGQVVVLELTLPQKQYFKGFYHIYLNMILPLFARVFSPNPDAYIYLGESIMNFPTVRDFARLMKEAGLIDVEAYALTLGICHLFIGHKPNPDNQAYGENRRGLTQRREGF